MQSTLRWIVTATPSGSGVVFDYARSPSTLGLFERLVFWVMARRVAAVGEPWQATFKPGELMQAMHEMGYVEVVDLHARAINARYFAKLADGLKVGTLAGLILART